MGDYMGAFIYDAGFFSSSMEHGCIVTDAIDPVALADAVIIKDNTGTSDKAIEHQGCNSLAATACKDSSIEVNVQDVNPHRETLVDALPCSNSDRDNAAPGEVPTHSIEPKYNEQGKSAEPDTVTPQVGITENLAFEDSGLGTSEDPECASALGGCHMKAAANSEDAAPGAIFLACKAARDTQGEAENTENGSVEAAFRGENPASDVGCPPRARRNIHRSMRPSRGIHPIGDSPSVTSQTLNLSVVIQTASEPRPKSRKRAAVEQTSETAKRARQSDQAPVSQGLRPRRSTRSWTEEAHYKYEFESVQRESDNIQRDVDDLDIQNKRDVKAFRHRLRMEVQEIVDRIRESMTDMIQETVSELEKKFELDREAVQQQLDKFKYDLKNVGLIDTDA